MTCADSPTVRFAEAADLPGLAAIEAGGDELFDDLFGGVDWDPPQPGEGRAAQPGFLLVAGSPAVGFAHVLEEPGSAHLEQLVVRAEFSRRGIGSGLVEACCAEAARRGHDQLSLTTYADVPWNAPYYRRLGFVEVAEPVGVSVLSRHLNDERDLERHGRRVAMVRRIKE